MEDAHKSVFSYRKAAALSRLIRRAFSYIKAHNSTEVAFQQLTREFDEVREPNASTIPRQVRTLRYTPNSNAFPTSL